MYYPPFPTSCSSDTTARKLVLTSFVCSYLNLIWNLFFPTKTLTHSTTYFLTLQLISSLVLSSIYMTLSVTTNPIYIFTFSRFYSFLYFISESTGELMIVLGVGSDYQYRYQVVSVLLIFLQKKQKQKQTKMS